MSDAQAPPRWRQAITLVVALALIFAGFTGLGFGGARTVQAKPRTYTPAVYAEPVPCPSCADGVRLDSVEVQRRGDNHLFVVRGAWPAAPKDLHEQIRFVSGATEVVVAVRGGEWVLEQGPEAGVGVGLRRDAFMLSVPAAVVAAPLRFEIGLWDGSKYLARLPKATDLQLAWNGRGAAQARDGLVYLAAWCRDLTSLEDPGVLAPALGPSGPATDPRTAKPTFGVKVDLPAHVPDAGEPYAIAAILTPPSAKAAVGKARIDRVGTVQLWFAFDGEARAKGIRTWDGKRWTIVTGAAADALTLQFHDDGLSFFYAPINPEWEVGFVTATARGCASAGFA